MKSLATSLLFCVCLLAANSPCADAVVLAYHHVDASTPASTSISPELFRQHLKFLRDNQYQVVPLHRISTTLRQGQPMPSKQVALTFDDGYISVFTQAWPLLQEFGFPFTVFVHTSAIGEQAGKHMSWTQLTRLRDNGVEIANHSHQHAHLPALSLEQAMDDIAQAQQLLHQQLGVRSSHVAYPYGEFSPALAAAVQAQGWVGFGQHSGAIGQHSSIAALPRFPVSGNYAKLSAFAQRINTVSMPVRPEPANGLVTLKVQPSVQLRFANGQPPAGLACYATGQGVMQLTANASGVRIRPKQPLAVGRTKFNCTAPSSQAGQFQWWSYLVMKPNADGSWYGW